MMKTFNYVADGIRFVQDSKVPYSFLSRCRNIARNWEIDGSREISGVSLSSVRIEKDSATFYFSGYYIGRMGEYKILTVYADNRKSVRY